MKFPYYYFEGQFLPIVPLQVQGKDWIEILAYVDTGASYCLFPADTVDLLGLKLEQGEYREMVVGDGDTIQVYLHQVQIRIAGKQLPATIGFSSALKVGFYILGRKDIFQNFLVLFNEKEKYVEFTSHG